MRFLYFALFTAALMGCNSGKKYYVSIHESGPGGSNTIKDSVIAESDSDAYFKGIIAFKGRYMAYQMLTKKGPSQFLSRPTDFVVTNTNGADIIGNLSPTAYSKAMAFIQQKEEIPTEEPTKTASTQSTSIDSATIKALSKNIRKNKDEFNATTWIYPKSAPIYRNRNGLFCYFQQDSTGVSNLRFVIQYASDDWLFIQSYKFVVDGKNIDFDPMKVETDNGEGGVWEWSDEGVSLGSGDLVKALAQAKTAKYRMEGRQYYKDREVSPQQIKDIKMICDLYRAMGGSF